MRTGSTVFLADTLDENRAMLGVFMHSGYPVTRSTEYGTVSLRFPIELTDTARAALAHRDASRQVDPAPPGGPQAC